MTEAANNLREGIKQKLKQAHREMTKANTADIYGALADIAIAEVKGAGDVGEVLKALDMEMPSPVRGRRRFQQGPSGPAEIGGEGHQADAALTDDNREGDDKDADSDSYHRV